MRILEISDSPLLTCRERVEEVKLQVGPGHWNTSAQAFSSILACRKPVEEVNFQGGPGYWDALAKGLQCQPEDMLIMGKVGKVVSIPLAPGEQPPPDSNQPICVCSLLSQSDPPLSRSDHDPPFLPSYRQILGLPCWHIFFLKKHGFEQVCPPGFGRCATAGFQPANPKRLLGGQSPSRKRAGQGLTRISLDMRAEWADRAGTMLSCMPASVRHASTCYLSYHAKLSLGVFCPSLQSCPALSHSVSSVQC